MDGQGKHVIVGPDGARTIEWTPELLAQRERDEAKHWEKLARRAESNKIAEQTIPLREQMRILRSGDRKAIEAMNAAIAAAEQSGAEEAARIRAEAPAKVAAVRAELEAKVLRG